MNIFATIILATLLIEYILHLAADILNLRTLSGELPGEFEGVYEPEKYMKSHEYTRVRTKFGIVTSTVSLLVTLAFWFSGGFNRLDLIVGAWNTHVLWSGLAYIGILLLARSIISLTFTIYSTFVIEKRFGFNRTTPKVFVMDLAKGLVLSALLGGPLLAGILALFQYSGELAWLYCWIATSAFTLIVQFIAPTWIMPLFNKFTPLGAGELKDAILSLAQSVNFSHQDVYVMDGSKRSSKTNAFFTGFGKHKRIALFDTLVAKHTVPELVGVLAHEIGHYKKKHIVQGIVISILHMGLLFFLLSVFVGNRGLFDAFFMERISVSAGLVFFGLLYTPLEFIISILLHIVSRAHEFEADRFAAEATHQPQSMIDALKKLSVDNLSHLTPHPFYIFLNYSHPPVLERIRAIRSLGQRGGLDAT